MKTFLIISVLGVALAISGCGGDEEPQQASAPSTTTQPETVESTSSAETEQAERTETQARKPAGQSTDTTPAGGSQGGGATPPSGGNAEQRKSGRFAPASDADSQAVRAAVGGFYIALANGNGGKACSLMTSDVSTRLVQELSDVPQFKGKDCAEVMVVVSQNYPEDLRTRLRELKVTKVSTNGDRAIASYTGAGLRASQTQVQREGGSWKVAVFGGVPPELTG
jgi:hypothetical protein